MKTGKFHQFFLCICTVVISQLIFLFILITFSNILTPSELTEKGIWAKFLVSVIIQAPFFNSVHFYVIYITRSSLKHVEQANTRSASDQSASRKSLYSISNFGWYRGFSNTLNFGFSMVFSYNCFIFLDFSYNSGFNSYPKHTSNGCKIHAANKTLPVPWPRSTNFPEF